MLQGAVAGDASEIGDETQMQMQCMAVGSSILYVTYEESKSASPKAHS
jgi:hypothetical protein